MSNTFKYVRYDNVRAEKQELFRTRFEELEKMSNLVLAGRPRQLFLTRLEEAYMWIGKALRDEQIAMDGRCEEETHRG